MTSIDLHDASTISGGMSLWCGVLGPLAMAACLAYEVGYYGTKYIDGTL